jgi:hypothetical protein
VHLLISKPVILRQMELCTKCSIYIFKWIYLLAMCMHCVFSIEICIFFEILKI